ncbi:methyltransferase family protein [Serratia fonticola]|uniref:Methyltransferase family protein n=1 Tax=Serratia fonticola TaxID=47917 RepID=A0A542D6X0_SERFO|nr:class I SAM-dependent methyltransferase [Serratia fonticola]TQI79150.1 methyltransferase family protein [Serratia fonticola]TQI98826.1 methyltransferase family protein [Serratia fonticola]TVZ68352.1 methyltransferase family protein [Serratia fonticola]
MSISNSHKNAVDRQFGEQANAYLTSSVHAQGNDLQRLTWLLAASSADRLLDLGCGAGHASFTAAPNVAQVVAYDLSAQMLAVVSKAAQEKGLANIQVQQGVAESLPFDNESFEVVISRYSAHHWHDVGRALREVRRVLKPGGRAIFMDVVSPGHPLLDIYLQTVEVLRDTSHVRNYAPGEWLSMLTESGLLVREVTSDRLELEFGSWVARMRTPEHFVTAIRALQQGVAEDVRQHFAIQADGSFTSDIMMFDTVKG